MMSSWSPTATFCRPFDAHGCTSSQASGAPSDPCRGALCRSLMVERMNPIGRSEKRLLRLDAIHCFYAVMVLPGRAFGLPNHWLEAQCKCVSPHNEKYL